MKLFITPTSPYARVVRMAIEELGFSSRVEIIEARTRTPECEVNELVPTGKVPMLVTDDGHHLSETRLIIQYLDAFHTDDPLVDHDPEEADRALEGVIIGFLDGVSVLIRELGRPEGERSPGILEQERARVSRCLPWFDKRVDELGDRLDYPRMCLAVTLSTIEARAGLSDWRESAPALGKWHDSFSKRASFIATRPPGS